MLTAYEIRLATALFQEPPFETIYEIGSGVSALPMFLALNGASAVGIERDTGARQPRPPDSRPARRESPRLFRTCATSAAAAAPAALRGIDGADCAAVFTNVTGSMTPEEIEEVIAQMAAFRAVVVDLSRFFEVREKTAQAALLDRLIAAGWGRPAADRHAAGYLLDVPAREGGRDRRTPEAV